MLGQAAAMLIPFPAAIAAKIGHIPLPFAFDQVRSFAGPTVPILGQYEFIAGVDSIHGGSIGRIGGGLAGHGRVPQRTLHTP